MFRYHSYLLRFWQQSGQEPPAWHFEVINPHTGERHGFSSPEKLVSFLLEETHTYGPAGDFHTDQR